MATFSYTTTPDQDAGIAAMLRLANQVVADYNAANPGLPQQPAWTALSYVRAAVATMLDGWAAQSNSGDLDQLRVAWQDPVKRAAIKSAAGIV